MTDRAPRHAEFTVSVEHIDGKWRLCALGNVPPGFRDIRGFDSIEEAEDWLVRWATTRRVGLSTISPHRHWMVSYG